MICPACQHENPENARYCNGCGHKLELTCSECGNINPPGSRFCNGCSHNLTQPSEPTPKTLSFDEKIEKIQRYLPKGLTEKILSQRNKIEGEKKQVTVMFCDMEGFTPLVEKIGPEEAYSIMDQVYEILIHKAHDYEGTVNEMTGDGIMALFGAPIALEDAPQRAIRSAYAIHREMTGLSDKIKQERGGILPLKMRIGIHTGPVVVGSLGNDLRVEFKAVGDTVNLASRMEDLAEPGATYVTEETFKLTEGLFRYESMGEKKVRGKKEPVKTYRVIGPSTRRTRFDVSAERGLTPFLGRERELEILADSYERAKAGRGQAISIVSDAGVGKSRLLYEFRKTIANEDVTILEGKCLSYSRGVAYHPIIDLYKSNFDIGENDEDYQIKNKVKRGLKQLDLDEASSLPYLLELLSVKDSGFDQIPMSPEGKKDRMIETMIRIPLKGSEIKPLIMAIEDLHWIDRSSEEALKYVLDSISGARVLIIFTYRPEFVHTWSGRSYHNQVNLNRLSNRESLSMVTHLLDVEDIEEDLEDLLLEKTEGIPFFIEEFIKSLKDLKIIEKRDNIYHLAEDTQDLTIPSTIQDVIMARVDSLPEGIKEVIQTGSVIEREFDYELIKRVTDIPERELLSHLSVLKDVELLYERGIFPKSTFIFKHALTREVVYDSILTKRKKILHGEIGNRIEELYKDKLDEYYGVLADHFIKSGNDEMGAEYYEKATGKAESTASFSDAIDHAKRRVTCLEKLPQSAHIQLQIADARIALGRYYFNMNYLIEAKEAIDPIYDFALVKDDKRRLSLIYTLLGSYYAMVEENPQKATTLLSKSLNISKEVQDGPSEIYASLLLGLNLSWDCEFARAEELIIKALDMITAFNISWAASVMKSNLSIYVYHYQGKIDAGYATSEEAFQMIEQNGDIFSKAYALTSHGISCYYKGFWAKAKEFLHQGADICKKIKLLTFEALAHQYLGLTWFQTGEYEKSQDALQKAIFFRERTRIFPSTLLLINMSLARSQAMNNDEYRDPDQLYDSLKENNVKVYEGTMAILMGEILLCKDDHPVKETEDWIQLAMKIHKSDGMMWHFARDLVVYADFLKSVDDTLKAYENLNMAKEIFTQCGADGWSDMVKQLLLDSENIITMKGGEKKAGEIDINDNKKSNQ